MSDEMLIDDVPENDTPDTSAEDTAPEADNAPAQQQVEQAPQPTVWDAFKSLPDFQGKGEREIASRLYQAMEREKAASHALSQYQQILPHAQQYLQDRPEYEKWRASQQAQVAQPAPQQQAAPPQEEKWWNPPPVRDAYKKYIVRDENGRESIHPDTPLDARHALTEHFQYRADFAEKFLSNPEEALGPIITRFAAEQAQQIVQEKLQEAGRTHYVATLEEQNKDWLYSDPAKKIVSPEGAACQKYIEQAAAFGIATPEARWEYALQMVERDLLLQVQQTQASQAQTQAFQQHLERSAPPQPVAQPAPQRSQAEANMEYLRRAASRTANRAGVETNSPQIGSRGRSFEDQLRATLETDGLI
jgi:hypothetical protein